MADCDNIASRLDEAMKKLDDLTKQRDVDRTLLSKMKGETLVSEIPDEIPLGNNQVELPKVEVPVTKVDKSTSKISEAANNMTETASKYNEAVKSGDKNLISATKANADAAKANYYALVDEKKTIVSDIADSIKTKDDLVNSLEGLTVKERKELIDSTLADSKSFQNYIESASREEAQDLASVIGSKTTDANYADKIMESHYYGFSKNIKNDSSVMGKLSNADKDLVNRASTRQAQATEFSKLDRIESSIDSYKGAADSADIGKIKLNSVMESGSPTRSQEIRNLLTDKNVRDYIKKDYRNASDQILNSISLGDEKLAEEIRVSYLKMVAEDIKANKAVFDKLSSGTQKFVNELGTNYKLSVDDGNKLLELKDKLDAGTFERVLGGHKIPRAGDILSFIKNNPTKVVLGLGATGYLAKTTNFFGFAPWSTEETWQMTGSAVILGCAGDPVCMSERFAQASNTAMSARWWYMNGPLGLLAEAPLIGDLFKILGMGPLHEFAKTGLMDQISNQCKSMCELGTWDCSVEGPWGFGVPKTADQIKEGLIANPELLFKASGKYKYSQDQISNYLKIDCSGGECRSTEGSILEAKASENGISASGYLYKMWREGKIGSFKLPSTVETQFKDYDKSIIAGRGDKVPDWDAIQKLIKVDSATTGTSATPTSLKDDTYFKDKNMAFVAQNMKSGLLDPADIQKVFDGVTTNGKLDLAKVKAWDPSATYKDLEALFPGQVVPALQAEFAAKIAANKTEAFKEAGQLEANNQLPIGVTALDVMPADMKQEFSNYNSDPANFKDTVTVTQGGDVTWTDLTGRFQSAYAVNGPMAFNPTTMKYDIPVKKTEANGSQWELNRQAYYDWANKKGAGTLAEFTASSEAYTCTYKCDATTSSTSKKSSSGGSSYSKSSSSSTKTTSETGLFIDTGGLQADITIGGAVVGKTDEKIPMDAGTYDIVISKTGYKSRTMAGVVIYSSGYRNLSVTLYKDTTSTTMPPASSSDHDVCAMLRDIGGVNALTSDHVMWIFYLYKGWDDLALALYETLDPQPSIVPNTVYKDDFNFLYGQLTGDTTTGVTIAKICPIGG